MGVDVQDLLSRVTTDPMSVEDAPLYMRQAFQALVSASASAAEAEGEVGAVEVAGTVGILGTTIASLVIFVVLLGIVLLVSFLSNLLVNAVSRIPWVGGSLAKYIRLMFSWETFLSNALIELVTPLVNNLWHDLASVIGYFAGIHAAQHPVASQIASGANVASLQGQVNANTEHLTRLQDQVNQLNAYVHNNPAPTLPQGVLTLPEQLYKVEQDVQILYQNQNHFYTELQSIVAQMGRIAHDLQQIESTLVGTRAIEVGFQDLAKQFNDLTLQTQALESYFGAKVDENTRSIGILQPLNLLLEPGLPGLRNLRKLEDDPCQCPKLPGIGNELGTALALLEFVENG